MNKNITSSYFKNTIDIIKHYHIIFGTPLYDIIIDYALPKNCDQWEVIENCMLAFDTNIAVDNKCLMAAIKIGDLQLFNLLIQQYNLLRYDMFSSQYFSIAIKYKRSDIIKFLINKTKKLSIYGIMHHSSEEDVIEYIKYFHKFGKITINDIATCLHSALYENKLLIVKYLISNFKIRKIADYMNFAAQWGRIDIMDILHKNGFPCTSTAHENAAGMGQLNAIKWLYEHHREGFSDVVIKKAIDRGNLEMAKFLFENFNIKNTHKYLKHAKLVNSHKCFEYIDSIKKLKF